MTFSASIFASIFFSFLIDFSTLRPLKNFLIENYNFHKITVFTFSSNFDPKWDLKSMDFSQTRARRNPKITKMVEKIDFLVDQNLSSNFGRKKKHKRSVEPAGGLTRRVGQRNVDGRREGKGGKPSQLWSNLGLVI